MSDVKHITSIEQQASGKSAIAAIAGSVGQSAQTYLNRRGVSDGTAEDAMGIAVKAAVDALDKLDGRQDGVIHRSAVVKGYKEVQQMEDQLQQSLSNHPMAAKPAANFGQQEIAMAQAALTISQLPAAFRISDAAQDAAIRKAVAAIDTNHDGRISEAEEHAPKVPNVLKQLVKDLTTHR